MLEALQRHTAAQRLGESKRKTVMAIMEFIAFVQLAQSVAKEICWDLYGDDLMARVNSSRWIPDDSRAQIGAQQGVVTLVIVGATLIIGVVVYVNISDAAPTNHSMSGTQDTIDTTVGSSFELGAIIPLVVVAVVLLGLLGMFGVAGGQRGGRR